MSCTASPGFDPSRSRRAAEQFFSVEPLPAGRPAGGYIDTLAPCESGIAFVAVTRAGAFLLRPQAREAGRDCARLDLPENQRQLDLSHFHTIILDRLLGLNADKVREQTNLRYLRDAAEAVDQVRAARLTSRFSPTPSPWNSLQEVACAGSVMPQKSTDFFPKLLSGAHHLCVGLS